MKMWFLKNRNYWRVKRKTSISSREGNLDQGRGSSYSNIYNELFQAHRMFMYQNWEPDLEILVGTKMW